MPALPVEMASRVVVGTEHADDAAVYRLDDETGIVATVDVFTPIVDDPREFGRIAAANSLSDVYAMGAQPLFALSVVGFPIKALPIADLGAILRGAADVAAEAGIGIIGGHSIDDPEPKFGLCVIGRVGVDAVVRNDRAQPGDVLILTKPIGSGIITTGIKRGSASAASTSAAIAVMSALNRGAGEAMAAVGVHAATDITGFGLLGHLHEMAHGSGVSVRLRADAVPLIEGARDLAAAGVVPGGTRRNLEYFGAWVEFAADVDETTRILLADSQTSGGLLVAVAPERRGDLERALAERGVAVAAEVGVVEPGQAGRIAVVSGAV